MQCKIKVFNFFISDILITDRKSIKFIELHKYKFFEFANGQEAEFIKDCIVKQMEIPEENIKIFMVEKE